MFGFLKKKLKDAVSKFTKKAEEEVIEEKVEDAKVIEEAKEQEKELLKESVEEVPETQAEKEQHEREEEHAPKQKAVPKKQKTAPSKPKEAAPKKPKAPAEPKKKAAPPKEAAPKKPAPKTPSEPVTTLRAVQKEEESIQEVPKKGFLKKLFSKEEVASEKAPEPVPTKPAIPEPKTPLPEKEKPKAPEPEAPEPVPKKPTPAIPKVSLPEEEKPEVKHGLFKRLKESFTKKRLSEKKFEELFWDLEVVLLENNVAVEVIEKLKEDLKRDLTSGKVSRLGIEDLILVSLRKSIKEILDIEGFDLVEQIKKSKQRPYVILFIGVNGSGKTTTLAKVANRFQEEGLGVVMAASDTFRAAAIDQLKEHADKLSIKLVSQGYGADPAAVAYDAVEHAKAKGQEVVMIDTAGRLHSNTNLMAELEKVVRVAKPDLKIFIGESITGNDCVEQAKEFDKLVGIDAIILSKADVDEKGGAALSVSYVTGKPILYLGVGQAYGDLKRFDPEKIVQSLGL